MIHPYKVGDRLDSALFGPRFYRVVEVRAGCIVTQTPQGFRFECLPGSAVYESNRGRYPIEWGTPVAPIEDESEPTADEFGIPSQVMKSIEKFEEAAGVLPVPLPIPAANVKPKRKKRR